MINYDLDTPFPELHVRRPDDEKVIPELTQFVKEHIKKKDLLQYDLCFKQNDFRDMLVKLIHEKESLENDNESMKICNNQLRETISTLENRIFKLQNQIDHLLYKLNDLHEDLHDLQQDLRFKDEEVKQQITEKKKIIDRYDALMQAEKNRMIANLERELRQQRQWLEIRIKEKDNKLKVVKQMLAKHEDMTCMMSTAKNIIVDDTVFMEGLWMTSKTKKSTVPQKQIPTSQEKSSARRTFNSKIPSTSAIADSAIPVPKTRLETNKTKMDKIPIVNPQSQSSQDKWINHYSPSIVPIGTILHPKTAPCKQICISTLTDPMALITNPINYCLYLREQNAKGELETKLYKADVLPTITGGAQIVFNNIKYLEQASPIKIRYEKTL